MPGKGRIRIGTSGWAYKGWRGRFYPKGLGAAKELPYLSSLLPTVEVNGTFYSLTTPNACDRWRQAVPPEFTFAVKGSRYLTHMLKLVNYAGPLANFFASGILRLGTQLTCILWQLPPTLTFRHDRVLPFFDELPRDLAAAERWAKRHEPRLNRRAAITVPDGRNQPLCHAVEARHPSWFTDEALRMLGNQAVALVAADTGGRHPFSLERTTDFAYVRLHGSQEMYVSQYTDLELADWARTVTGWANEGAGADVYVYFDNDAQGFAPADAIRLQSAVRAIETGSRGKGDRRERTKTVAP